MQSLIRPFRRPARLASIAVVCVILVIVSVAGCGSTKSASVPPPGSVSSGPGPESIFQAPAQLQADPAGTLDTLRRLGVDRVRVFAQWYTLAPAATSAVRPRGFDAADPAAYPAKRWAIYDTIVQAAAARGIGVDLTVTGPPPLWASGAGAPDPAAHPQWMPSAAEFGSFMRVLGTRYSGSYKPAGSSAPLPRVAFWAIWNEPNYGVDLAPQAIQQSTVEVSPALYRGLLDAGWSALQESGHGHDTILIGELAPRGITIGNNPGNFSGMVPLRFVRALYCVDSSYRQLRGAAAVARGCPSDAAGSAGFVRAHPALFDTTGFAVHPYPQGLAPNVGTPDEPDYADLPAIPRLESTLDTVQRVYGSSTRFPIFSTEFGYQTNPPETILRAISPPLAAYYLNWAEYITWQNPRLRSYDQYLLADTPQGNFATGLEFSNGTPKATYDAFRLAIYLPVTSTPPGRALEIWGCVRPAHYVEHDTRAPQHVQIQFRAGAQAPFQTVRTVTLTNPHGYFDVRQAFTSSGTLRLSWSYPRGPSIYSRSVGITVG